VGHASLPGLEPPHRSERSRMNAYANTFGSPSGEPSTTRPHAPTNVRKTLDTNALNHPPPPLTPPARVIPGRIGHDARPLIVGPGTKEGRDPLPKDLARKVGRARLLFDCQRYGG
jgi:hypothetical protein